MNDTDGHLFPEYECETEKNASQNKSNIELIYHKYPKEELLFEYLVFMKQLPKSLLDSEKKRLIDEVKKEFNITNILANAEKLDFEKLNQFKSDDNLRILPELSTKRGESLNILCPPTKTCLLCHSYLTMNNPPSQVVVHGITGPKIFSKYILRCRQCKLDDLNPVSSDLRQDVYYHPERYGNYKNGFLFYEQENMYTKASKEVCLENLLVQYCMANFMA